MNYRILSGLILAVITVAVLTAPLARAQADSTMYIVVGCMKSTSSDYVDVERDLWLPMHQEMVNQGQKAGWALYQVRFGFRDECDHYTVNRYIGADAVAGAFMDLPAIFAKVHPDADMDEAVERTLASREMVWSQLFALAGGIPPESFQYAHVNRMQASNEDAYIDYEMDTFRPVHQALVDDGITKGWLVLALVRPHGSAMKYNFTTVDFADHPRPIPFAEYVAKVHPDRTLQEIIEQGESVRELVLSETWHLLARTDAMMNDE
ncbi:MAG TPA: hypothetical protein VMO47_15030 [Rhodothermales bacterium]|nr:hypothetical protein [Rhodothermales bacterium]